MLRLTTMNGGVADHSAQLMRTGRLSARHRSQQAVLKRTLVVLRFGVFDNQLVHVVPVLFEVVLAKLRGEQARVCVEREKRDFDDLLLVPHQAGLLLIPRHL